MKALFKYTPEFILVAYILIFISFKHPSNSWERVINSDGKGYYAYLTAIFIYHDLDYKFVEYYEDKYYPPDRVVFKEFRVNTDHGVVNKCFPGLAIAWLPFFLVAHLSSSILGFEPNGYSLIYQYAIAFAALFYLWLGCRILFDLLKKLKATNRQAGFLTLLIGLGTNLIFYTIVEGSMTHVYSFALITLYLYTLFTFFRSGQGKWFVLTCFLFGLIVLIRPVNALVVLLIPAMASLAYTRLRAHFQLSSLLSRHTIFGLLVLLVLFSLLPLLWYAQTGQWIVYTYGEEGFNFAHPHFLSILFSYNRGWFIYTPIALVSLAGFAGLAKYNKRAFTWILFFLLLFIYVASSWWMWYYASKCGQRIFVDILVIPAILLLFLYKLIDKRRVLTIILSGVLISLLVLNLVQTYQHYRWIFPASDINAKTYWSAFFSFHPKAKVTIPETAILKSTSVGHDLEKPQNWMNEGTTTDLKAFTGTKSSLITFNAPYSIGLGTRLDSLFVSSNKVIRLSAQVFSLGSKKGALAVADFGDETGTRYYKAFYVEPFAIANQWTKIETAFYVPADLDKTATVKLYFYLPPGNDPLFIDDMGIDFLSLKEEKIYSKIDGVLIPTK